MDTSIYRELQAAAEHGESCFRLGLRCGLMLMADAQRPGREG